MKRIHLIAVVVFCLSISFGLGEETLKEFEDVSLEDETPLVLIDNEAPLDNKDDETPLEPKDDEPKENPSPRDPKMLFSLLRQIEEIAPKAEGGLGSEDKPSPVNLKSLMKRTEDLIALGKLPGLEGKNVAGMMDKIEGILKGGVKHAVPTMGKKNHEPHRGHSSPAEVAGNLYGGQSGEYQPLQFVTKEHSHYKRDPNKKLGVYDLKNIWLSMLYDIYKILNDDKILAENQGSVKTLEKIFLLLWDIDLVEPRNEEEMKCPYGFNAAGELCLSVEFIKEKLNWADARLYCQVVKGGDLVIFKDTCEFRDTVEFLMKIDRKRVHSYWVGATDLDKEGYWKFVDGSNVPMGAGVWGTRLQKMEPSGGAQQDFGILLNTDYFYMHDISNSLAVNNLNVIPICQYIPERDGYVVIPTKPTGLGPYAAYDDKLKNSEEEEEKGKKKYKPSKVYSQGGGYNPSGYGQGGGYSKGGGYNSGGGNPAPYKRKSTKTSPRAEEPKATIAEAVAPAAPNGKEPSLN